MAMIDLNLIPFDLLNFQLTEIAKYNYMSCEDLTKKTSTNSKETDEDVQEINAKASFTNEILQIHLYRGDKELETDDNVDNLWISNYEVMIDTLLWSMVDNLISSHIHILGEQIEEQLIPMIGGVFS